MTNCKQLYRASNFLYYVNCNDRLYIQSLDDLIIHDVRYPDVLYYIDLSVNGSLTPVIIPFDRAGVGIIPKQDAIDVVKIYGRFRVYYFIF